MRNPLKEWDAKEAARIAGNNEYMRIAGHLNRQDRRTAHGKLIVAEARIAALEAENQMLRHFIPDEQ